MTSPVKLYVYDLSRGMARQLSRQLTGRQIDGIWHTSVVVFGQEVFYGHGINITHPGQSHHGTPLQVIDMGETSLDQATWNEYLDDMRDHYTAEKYHLLDFNCNSFTNDCVGFLTGASIPPFIKDLPSDFLSTPFGAALRPTIDAMFRPPTPGHIPPTPAPTTVPTSNDSQLTASLLQAVASQAQSTIPSNQPPQPPLSATQSLAAPIHPSTNPASFHNLLKTHRAVAAFFTSATCPPCRMIEPIFERLAEEKGLKMSGGEMKGVAFTKVDMGVGLGGQVAQEWGVRVTPTFIFYLDGQKVSEFKGADANELRTQVDLLIFQAYPPHPHTRLTTPAIKALSLNPILFTQVPPVDSVTKKLISFIDANPMLFKQNEMDNAKKLLISKVAPYLKTRFSNENKLISAEHPLLRMWSDVTHTLVNALPIDTLFPLLDMWRLAFLDPAIGSYWNGSNRVSDTGTDPITTILTKSRSIMEDTTSAAKSRNTVLILLRLLANAFSTSGFTSIMLGPTLRPRWTPIVIASLLHEDTQVRTAAASLAFNAAAHVQKRRVDKVQRGGFVDDIVENEEWEVELISAVIEAVDREKENEEVVHRLVASLACLIRLSPFYEPQLSGLLEVLQCKSVLQSKLASGGCGESGVTKKDAKALIEEVAGKLCP